MSLLKRGAALAGFLAATGVHAQAASGLSALPLRRDGADDPSMIGAWVFLALLAAAATVAVWVRRKRNPISPSKRTLERLESVSLTSQVSLHVVRWGEDEVLVGCAPNSVNVISRRASPPAAQGGQQ